jgi:nucleoid DNA-binding protein
MNVWNKKKLEFGIDKEGQYHPQTKEKIQIPETKVPLFKAGKGLKEKIK